VVERHVGRMLAGVAYGGSGGGDHRQRKPDVLWSFLPLGLNGHRPPAMVVVCVTVDVDANGATVGLIKGEPLAIGRPAWSSRRRALMAGVDWHAQGHQCLMVRAVETTGYCGQ
jgi:hypothetical protein